MKPKTAAAELQSMLANSERLAGLHEDFRVSAAANLRGLEPNVVESLIAQAADTRDRHLRNARACQTAIRTGGEVVFSA